MLLIIKTIQNMENTIQTYKSDFRSGKIPPCLLDLSFFNRLFQLLEEITNEAIQNEISRLDKKNFKDDIDFENAKKNLPELLKMCIEIRNDKGEYILSFDKTIINDLNITDSVAQIAFDNSVIFRHSLKIEPTNYFHVEFDFRKQQIFDSSINPSTETANLSTIKVVGDNKTWVQGSYNRIMSTLDEYLTQRKWLHKKNTYDIFLYLLILPLSFLNIFRIERFFEKIGFIFPTVFTVFLYSYFFLIILFLFMIFFKYTRWIFPYIEYRKSNKKTEVTHRLFWYAILSAVIINMVLMVGKSLIF